MGSSSGVKTHMMISVLESLSTHMDWQGSVVAGRFHYIPSPGMYPETSSLRDWVKEGLKESVDYLNGGDWKNAATCIRDLVDTVKVWEGGSAERGLQTAEIKSSLETCLSLLIAGKDNVHLDDILSEWFEQTHGWRSVNTGFAGSLASRIILSGFFSLISLAVVIGSVYVFMSSPHVVATLVAAFLAFTLPAALFAYFKNICYDIFSLSFAVLCLFVIFPFAIVEANFDLSIPPYVLAGILIGLGLGCLVVFGISASAYRAMFQSVEHGVFSSFWVRVRNMDGKHKGFEIVRLDEQGKARQIHKSRYWSRVVGFLGDDIAIPLSRQVKASRNQGTSGWFVVMPSLFCVPPVVYWAQKSGFFPALTRFLMKVGLFPALPSVFATPHSWKNARSYLPSNITDKDIEIFFSAFPSILHDPSGYEKLVG